MASKLKSELEKAELDQDLLKNSLDFIEAELLGHLAIPLNEIAVDHLLSLVNAAQTEAKEIQRRILQAKPADPVPYGQTYCDLLKRITLLHRSLHGIKTKFVPTATPAPTTPVLHDIRLPRLDLQQFSGNITEWISFKDLFTSAVHNNKTLSDSQKLVHLKTLVTGEAARLLKSMVISDANYTFAWKQLQDRYQNDRELFFAITKKLIEQSHITSNSSESLRSLVDTTKEGISSLEIMGLKLDVTSNALLVYTVINKLDQTSRQLWEQQLSHTNIPTLDELYIFLEQRARALSAGSTSESSLKSSNQQEGRKRTAHTHHGTTRTCKVCKTSLHPLFKCSKFIEMTVAERLDSVRRFSLCSNCLSEGHKAARCSSSGRCRHCSHPHHTLIHVEKERSSSEPAPPTATAPVVRNFHTNNETGIRQTLLATALIRVKNGNGNFVECRALLDGGSTSSFITRTCVQRLNLRRHNSTAEVIGIGSTSAGNCQGFSTLHFTSMSSTTEQLTVNALILPIVTGMLPPYSCDQTQWPHLQGIDLADPTYHKPASMDILLGSDVFWSLLLDGKRYGAPGTPIGLRSTLGWLVAGPLDSVSQQVRVHHANIDTNAILEKFWEIEEVPSTRFFTPEEQLCEDHFSSTHVRDASGTYTVALPWKFPRQHVGSTREMAIRRLIQLERRLPKTPEYHADYIKFMREYETLGHMSLVPANEISNPKNPVCYIPHHYVLKEDSTTTKFRVVFDGTSPSSNGISLNSSMMVGPTIQDSLIEHIIRFRTYAIAFTADIAKMYRQIKVKEEDQDMQRIFWRESPSLPIREYRCHTVTYGTAAAPFLATRILQQLATDERESFPEAAEIMLRDFYVDDLMSGASKLKIALRMQKQLIEAAKRGGFFLRKWSSNSKEFLLALPEELRETNPLLDIDIDSSVKALGIVWNTTKDRYQFKCTIKSESCPIPTKRQILSEISKIFDPLGWLAPLIITAKILMQSIWKKDVGWDSAVDHSINTAWMQFKINMTQLSSISVPRCLIPSEPLTIKLAGFCDASMQAYGAVVYTCVYYIDKPAVITIVASKTRVAPVKQISLPRLELCGAVLLAELLVLVKRALRVRVDEVIAWTDSTVTLAWICGHPSRWQTFVANRVTQTQARVPSSCWRHVPGEENPADCCSRGISTEELQNHPLWWHGPSWLQDPLSFSPAKRSHPSTDDAVVSKEERRTAFASTTVVKDNDLLQRFPTLRTLLHITAYIRRFKTKKRDLLSPEEINGSLICWVKLIQQQHFSTDIHCLGSGKQLPSSSKLLSLHPFIDASGVLRVGGRLRNARISPDQRTPMLLPHNSKFTTLLIQQTHLDNFHSGPQLTLAVLHRRFWILRSRDTVRHQINRCVVCTRIKATTLTQFMGNLPASRVNPSRPFLTSGIDYAGPFQLKAFAGRCKTTFKSYLALFICFTTRAIHVEVVSSLSSEAFIAAFRRFIARRGKPSHMYSDCGTNFVGANKELKEMVAHVKSESHNKKMSESLSSEGVTWHFNPPGAPHFGGLWEAGVKSIKYHLYRVLGPTKLTFEEFTTTVTQIEACLNSRPLTPFSSDPSDLNVLTPGHFLIGGPLTAHPEPDLTHLREGRFDRWQHVQQLQQQFWKRWSSEFLTRLQQRPKWTKLRHEIKVDDMVIIKNEVLPPQMWKLGRVIRLSPGADGITRVVLLRTADGELTRPVTKLCLLPIENVKCNDDNNVI